MALPEVIEIIPLEGPVQAQITIPGSKSITNRALVLAALAHRTTLLRGALWSEDTQVMVDSLRGLDFKVAVAPDASESANRTITVTGLAGAVPPGGTVAQPRELFVGNAGTAARFLTALVCLGKGVYSLKGAPRMHERPQAALFNALRQLGYQIESPNNRLPALIQGTGPRAGHCRVSIAESSQFASALLLCGQAGGWQIEVAGENTDESAYVNMTRQLCARFPNQGGEFRIEPDASSGSYFWAAAALQSLKPSHALIHGSIVVSHWPDSGWQIDAAFPHFWPLPNAVSRQSDLGDSILTAMVLAPFADHSIQFTHLGRLRLQECERVVAMRTELSQCGVKVQERDDVLEIRPSEPHGAEIETYGDHRLAMCFAILGLKVAGIKIKNPACVKKTFPNFFQKLHAPPPTGLGAVIIDATTGRRLAGAELFAH